MADNAKTVRELAELTGSRLVGNGDLVIDGAAELAEASKSHISFYAPDAHGQKNAKHEAQFRATNAGAVVVSDDAPLTDGATYLVASNPSRAFQTIYEHFAGVDSRPLATAFDGIHPTAVIHDSVRLGDGVTIGPYAVIDGGAIIGDGVAIGSHCAIGSDTVIGAGAVLHPRVTVRERCRIGARCILQPGVVIGGCGFGYTTDRSTGKHEHLRQLGIVVLEDDVEVGANTTIDRARFGETRIGVGTKIDNQVQIGHGVKVGAHNMIVGQTGIAGSTTTGNNVVLAGQCAINGHIHLADGVIMAARSATHRSITESGTYCGVPAIPISDFMRNTAASLSLAKHVTDLKALKKQVKALEAAVSTSDV